MRVNFTVHGATAAELKEEADNTLKQLDPDARWKVSITATPVAETVGNVVVAWVGEVDAFDLTAGQY